MKNKTILPKIFAIAGTALVWFPVLCTVLTGIVGSIARKKLLFDYLMPAELFPVILIGAALLLTAALLLRAYRRLIGWSALAMIVFLAGGQIVAVASGLASGAAEATGFYWILVVFSIAAYTAVVVELGIVGLLLIRRLFPKREANS